MFFYNQKGFIPLIAIVAILLIGATTATATVIFKDNIPFVNQLFITNQTTDTASINDQPEATDSATASPSPSTFSPAFTTKATPNPNTSSKSTAKATPTPTPSTNASSPSNNSDPSPTATPNPTPAPTPSPTPSPNTYTWNGNNINTTTSCYTGDSTFDITVIGSVTSQGSDGVWTTLTGNGNTIIVSYQQGGNNVYVGLSFNDSVSSIRSQPSITLKTSGQSTYGYELKVYSAPYTEGIPSLINQIGNVSFATDCT